MSPLSRWLCCAIGRLLVRGLAMVMSWLAVSFLAALSIYRVIWISGLAGWSWVKIHHPAQTPRGWWAPSSTPTTFPFLGSAARSVLIATLTLLGAGSLAVILDLARSSPGPLAMGGTFLSECGAGPVVGIFAALLATSFPAHFCLDQPDVRPFLRFGCG